VAEVVRHVGSEHVDFVTDSAALTDPSLRRATMRCQDTPTHLGDMDSSLYLCFRKLREHGTTVALSGEGADEFFGGYFWAHDPALIDAGTFPWVAFERSQAGPSGGLGLSLLDQGLRKELDLRTYADDHYRDAVAEVPSLAGETALQRRQRIVRYLVVTRWLPTLLDREDRLSMANGIELRVPFCDHRLVEYLFNAPDPGGQEKSLLRAAVADLLPASVLQRPKSAYPATQDPAYGEIVRTRFLELARDPSAPVAPLLDADAVRAVVAAAGSPSANLTWVQRGGLEMALQLNEWLTTYRVRLEL
jgi:asparagine synthase (glutamine-hydrolysing)